MRPAADHPYFADATPVGLAHRGGSTYASNMGRENTVYAFRQAVDMGYRYLETDVHATSDGELIAFHDEVLDRVTDATGTIAELPWSEVSRARIHGIDAVPTMDELFETFPDVRFNIDLKAPGAVEPLIAAIRRHDALDRVCVGSFDDARLAAIRKALGPGLATSAGPREVAAARLLPRALTRLLRSPAVALQIPVSQRIGPVSIPLATRRLVDAAHSLGKHVHVWTIDEADEMHRLLDLGVDGIVTDRIDTLRDVLAERGRPLRP